MRSTQTSSTSAKLLFIVKARMFHGLTRKEAIMLWDDGIDTLYTKVESIHLK